MDNRVKDLGHRYISCEEIPRLPFRHAMADLLEQVIDSSFHVFQHSRLVSLGIANFRGPTPR